LASKRAATVIGVVGLLLGSCGASSAGYELFLPRMLDMQREFIATVQAAEAKRHPDADAAEAFPTEIFAHFERWTTVPESVRPWFPVTGLVGLAVFAALGFAGLLILLQNPLGARILPWAAGATLAWALFKVVLAVATGAFLLLVMAPGALVNAVSAVVIAAAARHADLGPEPPAG
jgi:hypothetical protein